MSGDSNDKYRLVNWTNIVARSRTRTRTSTCTCASDSNDGQSDNSSINDDNKDNKQSDDHDDTHDTEFLPRTIEFRQHTSTLSSVSVERWIAFVVGMVRVAEANARNEERAERAGCRTDVQKECEMEEDRDEKEEEATLEELMSMMGLESEERRFWVERRREGERLL